MSHAYTKWGSPEYKSNIFGGLIGYPMTTKRPHLKKVKVPNMGAWFTQNPFDYF
jgi:hypothetical protein